MPYEFESSDLADPRETRHPGGDLSDVHARAYEAWLNAVEGVEKPEIGGETSQQFYQQAVDALDGVDVDPVEATALPLAYPDRTPPDVGLFLSAAYNLADETVVAYDVAAPVKPRRLGYRLPADTALVIDAPVHSSIAVECRGLVVNRASVERYFGYSDAGAFVNCGSCLTTGFETAHAFVELGDVRGQSASTDGDRGIALDGRAAVGNALSPGARAYLDTLVSELAGDLARATSYLERLDPTPRDAVAAAVADHLPADE